MTPSSRVSGAGFKPHVTPEAVEGASSFVYCLWPGEHCVKIGTTSRHPTERVSDLQTGCPGILRVVAYTTHLIEKQAHRRLHKCRLHHEWFKINPALVKELETWDWCDAGVLGELRKVISNA
jgi:hypothetical protein